MSSKMTERENMLRTIFFQKPDYIPVNLDMGVDMITIPEDLGMQ